MKWFVIGIGFYNIVPWIIETGRSWYPSLGLPCKSGTRSPLPLRWILISEINNIMFGTFLWLAASLYDAGWTNLLPYTGFHGTTLLRVLAETLLILVLMDFHFYWFHRLMHRNRWLYRNVHIFHHRAVYPTAWHSQILHPVDFFLATLCHHFWILFLPFSVEAYIFALLMAHAINIAGHAGYEISKTWASLLTFHGPVNFLDPHRRHIGRVWANVAHHDLHHRQVTGNFGLYFTWWDSFGKTECPPTPPEGRSNSLEDRRNDPARNLSNTNENGIAD